MSIFTPINKFRSRCTICNAEVSKTLEHRHQDYHVLGDMALSKTESLCPICKTPISIKAQNFSSHLKGFHKLSNDDTAGRDEAKRLSQIAKQEAEKRDTSLPKPKFSLQPQLMNDIQVNAEQMAMKKAENQIEAITKKGRPRTKETLPGESDEQRKLRMNRENVMRFRDKQRAQKGLTGPKRLIKKQLQPGESVEEYDRRLHSERMKRYRQKLKENKN